LAEVIDAGDFDFAIVADVIALAAFERDNVLFGVEVNEVLDVVLLAPLGLLSEEGVLEDAAPDVVIIGAGAAGFFVGLRAAAVEEGGDIGLEVVAFAGLELVEEFRRPGDGVGVIGLIAEEA